ncbi:uncharacterized protein N7506_001349 [Penicillium brevicompactum]|uniref:uncharacterized protein n=1 Tax=Penicillium brevicompactum TaxID=5074 RepID=UPI0025419830|nr:uncharacterized protein N7506_001349 [Penicillium brevicompactum]KAJ5348096.1 hypothetical protein N7506_001349 [Penicillium brevicompactum]
MDIDWSTGTVIDPEGDVLLSVPSALSTPDDESTSSFLVSSKHLKTASCFFNAMLSSRWDEGRSLAANGKVEIKLKDTHPFALKIFLNVAHLKFRQLPKKLTWEQLLEVAVVTDYLHCHEVMGPFAKMWMDGLWPFHEGRYFGNPPAGYGLEAKLAGSITITSVFQATDILNNLIRDAIGGAKSDFDTEDLPIAAAIKDFIDETRTAYLRHKMRIIEAQAWRLMKGKTAHCDPACDAMCFGLLYKTLLDKSIYLQVPEKRPALSSDSDPSTSIAHINLYTIAGVVIDFYPTKICPRLGVSEKEVKPSQVACCNKSDTFWPKDKSKPKYSQSLYGWLAGLKIPKFLPRGLK